MNTWNIRKATKDDSEGLKECMDMSYSKYLDRIDKDYLPPLNVNYEDEILNYPVWVVEDNNKIVGGLILVFDENYASIANIAVHPITQGRGLGKFLMNFAEDEAANRGYKEINLATHILLTENVTYYEKLGWSKVNQDNKKVYMKKLLNN